jgi:C4-dicarboxylate transporter, DctM subunit
MMHDDRIASARRPAWGGPLARLDGGWQRLESWLCVTVLVAEIAALTLWVVLKGLSTDSAYGDRSGLACRSLLAVACLGSAAHLASRRALRARPALHRAVVLGAMVAGLGAARLWAHAGVHASSNALNWLQDASSLTLIGGLRGLATRLTLWLALLGASLATSLGKNLHVDVVVRYIPRRFRTAIAIAGWLAAAVVCGAGAAGFVDYIGISDFRAAATHPCSGDAGRTCDAPVSERLTTIGRVMSADFFVLGRQASLDFRSLPHVLSGDAYDGWMTATEWNAWLDGADWTAHFDRAAVDGLRMDPSAPGATRAPQVSCPGTGDQPGGLLIRDLNFVFPFGLAILAIKFVLRILLVLAGQLDAVAVEERTETTPRAAKIGMSVAAVALLGLSVWGSLIAGAVVLLALLGTPLMAVLGGSAEILWLLHPDEAYRHLRFVAPTVLDERFSDNPVVVTIPLFTFVGFVLAEAKTPDRLVAGARSALGWLPGGLAIVCIIASAIFTVLTGGSGVTIIAVGGLLYPALRKQGYSEAFSLGLVTTGGSVGLLLPSLPLGAYAILAHLDLAVMFKAVLVPGALVVGLLSAYSAWVAYREKVPREPPRLGAMAATTWDLKWEFGLLTVLAAGMGTGLTTLDEAAGLAAFYVVVIEFFVLRELSWKRDLARIASASMTLAGAIILILAMANALMNYVVDQHVPTKVLAFLIAVGIEHEWQFLIVMNVFLLLLGMLMEGFSAIFVAVPLLLPFVADLGARHPDEKMSPLQLGMIFLLNLEIAFCMPPLGLNLFLASFRFNRPVSSLYKAVLPFVGVLGIGLVIVSAVPSCSTMAVAKDITALRSKAMADGLPPRDAWMVECVQADPANPGPCSRADMAKYPGGALAASAPGEAVPGEDSADSIDAGCNPDFDDCEAGGPKAAVLPAERR